MKPFEGIRIIHIYARNAKKEKEKGRSVGLNHRENQYVEQAAINTIGKPMRSAGGFFVSELRQSAHKTSHSFVFLARAELCEVL